MKKRDILLTLLLFLISGLIAVHAQTANIEATPASGGTSLGPVTFNGNPQVQATAYNFNGGTLPAGWSSSPYSISSSICPGQNSPDNSNYFWATNTETGGTYDGKRYVETNAIDVSNGGKIEFYIRYADNEGSGCEQPDAANEWVYLQYYDGSSWVDIITWEATSSGYNSSTHPWYHWYWNSVEIPVGAQTANTKFRWYQPSNSGTTYDNWGLEDVSIGANVTVDSHEWKIDGVTKNTSGSTYSNTFPSTGSYTVYYGFTSSEGDASDQINYLILPENPTSITTTETTICNGSSTTLTANNTQGTVYWYTGGCGTTEIGTGNSITVSPNITTIYYARNYENGQFSASCASVEITVNPLPIYRSKQSGNWTTISNWEQYNGSAWEAATSYPGQISNSCPNPMVTVRATHTMNIPSGNITIPNLSIEANGLVTKDISASLTITDELIMAEDSNGGIQIN